MIKTFLQPLNLTTPNQITSTTGLLDNQVNSFIKSNPAIQPSDSPPQITSETIDGIIYLVATLNFTIKQT
jgi:hypothetical protein